MQDSPGSASENNAINDAVAPSITSEPVGSGPIAKPGLNKFLWAAIAGLFLVGLGALVWFSLASERKPSGPLSVATAPPAPSVPPKLLFAVSDDVSGIAQGKLFVANVDGKDAKDIGVSTHYNSFTGAATSPLGHVVFSSHTGSEAKAVYTIELVKPDGTRSKILTLPMKVWPSYLALSPDGQRLAYTRGQIGNSKDDIGIWAINTDGSAHTRLLSDTTYPQGSPYALAPAQWSRDGQYLLLQPGSSGTDAPLPAAFYRLKLATGTIEQIAKPQTEGWKLGNFKFSPDGTKFAYAEHKHGASTPDMMYGPISATALRTIDLTNGKATTIFEDNSGLYIGRIGWSADSKTLVYSSELKEKESVLRAPASGGKAQIVATYADKDRRIEQVAWVGDRIVYTLTANITGQKSELRTVKQDGKEDTLISSAAGVYFIGIRPQ